MDVKRWISSGFSFLVRNRRRIALTSIVAIVLALLVAYYDSWDPWTIFGGTRRRSRRELASEQRVGRERALLVQERTGQRPRLLLRIRRQYDTSCRHFLPTLKKKIHETVDISATVKKIKELRASGRSENAEEAEQALWDDIKISSFTLLFAGVYMTAAVCTLLRVQLYVLARSLLHAEVPDASSASSSIEELTLDSQMFRALLDGTYRSVFGSGLQLLDATVREVVAEVLADWQVKHMVAVSHETLQQRLIAIRQAIDARLQSTLPRLFIPEGELSGSEGLATSLQLAPDGLSLPSSGMVLKLLYQTWDILECEAFAIVYKEAVDSSMGFVQSYLLSHVFFPQLDAMQSDGEPGRTPPLASLLPQLKSAVNELLPDQGDERGGRALHFRTLGQSPLLESLCMAVLDAKASTDSQEV